MRISIYLGYLLALHVQSIFSSRSSQRELDMFCSSAGVHEGIQRASDLPLILVVLFNAKVGFSESKTFCVIGKSFRTMYSVEEHMYYHTIMRPARQ